MSRKLNLKRSHTIEKEISSVKETSAKYPNVMFGLEDQSDMNRRLFSGQIIYGDSLIPITFECLLYTDDAPGYPDVPPKVKFMPMTRDNYSSIYDITDDDGNVKSDTSFVMNWKKEKGMARFLDEIRQYMNNY